MGRVQLEASKQDGVCMPLRTYLTNVFALREHDAMPDVVLVAECAELDSLVIVVKFLIQHRAKNAWRQSKTD